MSDTATVIQVFRSFGKDVVHMNELAGALMARCTIADVLAWQLIDRMVADKVLLLNQEGQLREA